MPEPGGRPKCFIAMPITTHTDHAERYNGDQDHWQHVMVNLFEEAIEHAGFEPIRPAAQGAHLIHGLIIDHLSTADLVLVDLSSHNPNVFFELGVRTSLNLPIALVRDEQTSIPFDTSGINTHMYDSNLNVWEIGQQRLSLARHIEDSHLSCGGQNPLWRQFGLTIRASEPDANESPLEAKIDVLMSQFVRMQDQVERERAMSQADLSRIMDRPWMDAESESFTDLQMRDPGRVLPAELFLSAVRRYLAREHPGKLVLTGFEIVGATAIELFIEAPATEKDRKRIGDLAVRYNVKFRVRETFYADDGRVPLGGDDSASTRGHEFDQE